MILLDDVKKCKQSYFLARELVEMGLFPSDKAAYRAMTDGVIKYTTYGKRGKLVSKAEVIKFLKDTWKEVILELKLTPDNYSYLQRQVELEQQDGYEMTFDATINTMIDYFKQNNFFVSNARQAA